MYLTKDWLYELSKKYHIRPKEKRDALWPDTPTKSLGYFDKTKRINIDTVVTIADVIGCPIDELLRRQVPISPFVSGNNNQIGNVNITNDPESLHQIIAAQKQIIEHQDAEIKRMEQITKEQLRVKDQQIDDLGRRYDRLIEFVQGPKQ